MSNTTTINPSEGVSNHTSETSRNNLNSVNQDVLDILNSNNGNKDEPKTFSNGMTLHDYVSMSFENWISKRCGGWNPLDRFRDTIVMDEISEWIEFEETYDSILSVIVENETLDDEVLEESVLQWIVEELSLEEIFEGYNHLFEYVEDYVSENLDWSYDSDKLLLIVDIINENGGLDTFSSLNSVDEIIINGEKRTIEPNVYTTRNRFHQFSFSKYDEEGGWMNHNGFPYKYSWCEIEEKGTYEVVGSFILGDTPMCHNSLDYLGKSLLKGWDEVINRLGEVKQYLKTFEIGISYNNYGGTQPIYEFSLFNNFENKLDEVLNTLTNLNLFELLMEELGEFQYTDIEFIYDVLGQDWDELEWCLSRFIESHKEIGYELLTEDELKSSLSGGFDNEQLDLIIKTYSQLLNDTLEVV